VKPESNLSGPRRMRAAGTGWLKELKRAKKKQPKGRLGIAKCRRPGTHVTGIKLSKGNRKPVGCAAPSVWTARASPSVWKKPKEPSEAGQKMKKWT